MKAASTTIGLIPLGLANDSASFFMKTLNPVSFEHGMITAGATAIVGAAIAFVSTNNDNWNDISLHRSVQRPLSKKVGLFAAAAVATTALIMGGIRPIEPMPQTFVPATSAQPR